MTDRPSISQQATDVEAVALGHRGHLAQLRELAAKGKRTPFDLVVIDARIPGLEAAAETLRWVQKHEAVLREKLGFGREEG